MKYKVPRAILATITFFLAFVLTIQFNQGILLYPILTLLSTLMYFGKLNVNLFPKYFVLLVLFYPFGLFSFSLVSMAHNFHLITENPISFAWPMMILLNLLNLIPGLIVFNYTYKGTSLDSSIQDSMKILYQSLLKKGWFILVSSLALAFILDFFWIFFFLLAFCFSVGPILMVPKVSPTEAH